MLEEADAEAAAMGEVYSAAAERVIALERQGAPAIAAAKAAEKIAHWDYFLAEARVEALEHAAGDCYGDPDDDDDGDDGDGDLIVVPQMRAFG